MSHSTRIGKFTFIHDGWPHANTQVEITRDSWVETPVHKIFIPAGVLIAFTAELVRAQEDRGAKTYAFGSAAGATPGDGVVMGSITTVRVTPTHVQIVRRSNDDRSSFGFSLTHAEVAAAAGILRDHLLTAVPPEIPTPDARAFVQCQARWNGRSCCLSRSHQGPHDGGPDMPTPNRECICRARHGRYPTYWNGVCIRCGGIE